MIYTVTLSPALDYMLFPDTLTVGEIHRAEREQLFVGGKGINVSLILQELGVQSVATGFVAGFTGQAIEEGVKEKGITPDFVHLPKGRSRINVKIRTDAETDINCVGPVVDAGSLDKLFCKLSGLQAQDVLVLAGSLPQGVENDIYERLARQTSASVVVDATGVALQKAVAAKPFLVKPNLEELGELFGEKLTGLRDALPRVLQLQEMGAQNVLLSMGGKGAVLVTADGKVYDAPRFEGKVKNTVGAGDSMLAGFLAGFFETKDFEKALRLAAACGSATAFSEGLAKREDIVKLYN